MALGSTHLLTEVSTRDLTGCKRRPARTADYLIASRPLLCTGAVNTPAQEYAVFSAWSVPRGYEKDKEDRLS
jgi:hypothetical protein